MIIRAIVYSDDKDEALQKGKEIIEGMCGEDRTFDYATFFDEEENGISGKSRWGDLPPVTEVTTKEGKKLIDDGLNYTKQKFFENMQHIRKGLEKYRDIDIFEEKIVDDTKAVVDRLQNNHNKDYELHMFKYFCHCVGQYRGSDIFLYNDDGEGIRNSDMLKKVLTEWNKGQKVWVIPADVHL